MNLLKGKNSIILESLIKIIGIISILPVVFILIYILLKGLPSISWEFISTVPTNGMRAGGVFPAIVGTILLSIGTIIVSVPFGVLTGIYLVEYSKDNLARRVINLIILNLAGIPSIIYGLFGLSLFVIYMQMGASILAGSLTLGIMCLPVIITATVESLMAVPRSLREASLALGATKWETVWKVTLPSASPGILTGIILSISRSTGETAPIIFTVAAFYIPFLPEGIFDQVMALPYHLYVISTQVPNMPRGNMDGTLLILVTITVGFNLLGVLVRKKIKNRSY